MTNKGCIVYPFGYNDPMIDVIATDTFKEWRQGLRDQKAGAIIDARIIRVRAGLLGDVKSVGDGVSELRVDHGPGYRVYFTRRGGQLIILLCGGDKSSQARDIKAAQGMAATL